MAKTWRIVVLAMLLVFGSIGTAVAQGKPENPGGGGGNGGGPGSGEQCQNIVQDNGPDAPVVVLDPGHGGTEPGATVDNSRRDRERLRRVGLRRDPPQRLVRPKCQLLAGVLGQEAQRSRLATHMSGYLGTLTGDGRVGQFANGGLLHAEAPSALLETVFITNAVEAERLAAGMRQGEIASAIANGIAGWGG